MGAIRYDAQHQGDSHKVGAQVPHVERAAGNEALMPFIRKRVGKGKEAGPKHHSRDQGAWQGQGPMHEPGEQTEGHTMNDLVFEPQSPTGQRQS